MSGTWLYRIQLCPAAADHPYRTDRKFGRKEQRPPPAARTDAGYAASARANEAWTGFKKHAPYKTSGVKEFSPLMFLPLFSIVWDVVMDMMHIILGIWKRHIVDLLKGKRAPATVPARKNLTPEENAALQEDHRAVGRHLQDWKLDAVSFVLDVSRFRKQLDSDDYIFVCICVVMSTFAISMYTFLYIM